MAFLIKIRVQNCSFGQLRSQFVCFFKSNKINKVQTYVNTTKFTLFIKQHEI